MINENQERQPLNSETGFTGDRLVETNDDVISCLNGLIQTCKDGQDGFREAASVTEAGSTKTFFEESSLQRASFVGELQSCVRSLGGDPEKEGTVSAALHRGWIDIKAAVVGNDAHGILVECERGEDYAKKAYKDALEKSLPANVKEVVQRQSVAVTQTHDRVRDLRDADKNTNRSTATGSGGF